MDFEDNRPNWNVIKGWLEQAYGELTGNDSLFDQGNEDQIVGWLQAKLGKSEDEVRRILAAARRHARSDL